MDGVYAAVATPIDDAGRLNQVTFDRLVAFLLDSGVDGVCLGGATSEYPNVELADRKAAIAVAAARVPSDRALLVGIGAPSLRGVLDLGEAALRANSRGLLLPMPLFFRYEQHDLHAFSVEVSRTLRGPILLYDLPDFTNPLAPETAIALMRDEPFIVGIKDSSGAVMNLSNFAAARNGLGWTLLVGHDRLIHAGLQAGWNGTVSGIAGFCPELPLAIYRQFTNENIARVAQLQALLDEVIEQLGTLPAPWGIRVGLEARGFEMGPFSLPPSATRREQIERFRRWVPSWLERVASSVLDD